LKPPTRKDQMRKGLKEIVGKIDHGLRVKIGGYPSPF